MFGVNACACSSSGRSLCDLGFTLNREAAVSNHDVTPSGSQTENIASLLDEPPLARTHFLVLCLFAERVEPSSGRDILQHLFPGHPVWAMYPPIYRTIGLLAKSGHLEKTGEVKQASAPPLKLFRVTPAGLQALDATRTYYEALVRFASKV